MDSIGLTLMVAAATLHAILEIQADPSIDRRFIGRTLAAAAVFLLYVVGGALAFVGLLGRTRGRMDPEATLGLAVLFLLGWIAYGTVLLIRVVPRRREPPRWLMRVGWADAVLWMLMVGAAAALIVKA